MKVSCIIPSYNDKKFILKCIGSLKQQSLHKKDFEIIVVDDGSTDGTSELLKKIKGIKLFSLKHAGRSKARNYGLQKTKAPIVFFAESDAVYSKNFLKDCLKHFTDPEVGGVIGKLEALNLESPWVQCRAAELNARFEKNYKPFTAWMYRAKTIKELKGFDARLDIGEDVDLGQRVLKKGFRLVYEKKAVWKHFEPDTIKKVWKRFWFRGSEMPKYYKKNSFPWLVLLLDFIAFASIPAFLIDSLLPLIFVFYAIIQALMRIDYFNFIKKSLWLHLLFYLFTTMVVSKAARLYGLLRLVI